MNYVTIPIKVKVIGAFTIPDDKVVINDLKIDDDGDLVQEVVISHQSGDVEIDMNTDVVE